MKRLIVFCDGTWNTPDQKDRGAVCPSNVVKLRNLVELDDANGNQQLPYYDKGVGTGDPIDRLFGGMFGIGLSHNIREAYEFLSLNYEDGDQVFLFGFSRGAYTVRRTVGMIRKCQLLPRISDLEARRAVIKRGYDVYLIRGGGPDSGPALAYRKEYSCRPIKIHCLGVWDTVGTYGIGGVMGQLTSRLSKSRFHDRRLSSIVEHAYQAVAIDEARRLFGPTLFEKRPTALQSGNQVLEQSWFAGVHSNVGGGYQDAGLSDIALQWMAARAEQHGLFLEHGWRTGLNPNAIGELRDSRTGLYQFMGKAVRSIGEQKNGFEKAHNTPMDRMTRDLAGYEPDNLVAYRDSGNFKVDVTDP